MSRFLTSSLVAAALALGTAASAQTPTPRLARPVLQAQSSALEPVPTGALRPLPASAADLTLRGELSTQERAVFLTAADALRVTAFQINYTNAVSNLPEASRLIVRINDQQVGEIPLTAAARPMTSMLPLPPGLVVPGFNSVRLTAVQRHRVDCTADATYELWTSIDPRQTGFAGAGGAQLRRLNELPVLAGNDGGITRLRLRVNEGADARTIGRSMRVAQALVLLGWIQLPVLDVSPEPGSGPGIDLLVGTTAALADAASAGTAIIEPELGLGYLRENGSERSVITLTGQTAAELDAMILRLEAQVAQRAATGSAQGLRALTNAFGRRAESGTSFRFGDLGFETVVFDGALHRAGFQLMLPGDFFAAPYGKARLRFSGSYAAEGDVEGRLEVRVNDRIVSGIGLESRVSDPFAGRDIELPLDAFKPGMNTVSFEVRMRPRGQSSCDPTVRQPRARLVLSATSQIEFGQLARVGQYPRLASTVAYGLPYATSGRPLDVYVSAGDAVYLDAATTVVARMVASSQRLISTNLQFGRVPMSSGGGGMVVGPISEAPTFVGLSAAPIFAELVNPPSVGPPASRTQLASATPFMLGLLGQAHASDGILAESASSWSLQSLGAGAAAQRLLSGDLAPVTDRLREFGLLPPHRSGTLPEGAAPSGVVLTQVATPPVGSRPWQTLFLPEHRPEVWTAISAPTAAAMGEAIEELTRERNWSALDGARAIYRGDQRSVQSFEPAAYVYVAPAESSLGNWRLVGAGWLSLNVQTYLIAISIVCVLLGLFTALALRVVRR